MQNPVEIIASTRIVTDDGGMEDIGQSNAEHILQTLRTAGYTIAETPAEDYQLRAALGSALVGLQNAANSDLLKAAIADVKDALRI